MIMWTIVPEEQIFPISGGTQTRELELNPEEVNYDGCQILAQAVTESEYRIVRLLTSDPNDYLNPKLQPGKLINCRKSFEELSV